MSQRYKDAVQEIAAEIAEVDFSKDYFDLPKDLQQQVWRLAETQFVDGIADKYEDS